jgi:hypothetical protein
MPNDPSRKPEFNITAISTVVGAVAAVVAAVVAVLSYLHPTDTTHPIHLDFLLRTVSIPVWVIVFICGGIAIAAFIFRQSLKRYAVIANHEPKESSTKSLSRTPRPAADPMNPPQATTTVTSSRIDGGDALTAKESAALLKRHFSRCLDCASCARERGGYRELSL